MLGRQCKSEDIRLMLQERIPVVTALRASESDGLNSDGGSTHPAKHANRDES